MIEHQVGSQIRPRSRTLGTFGLRRAWGPLALLVLVGCSGDGTGASGADDASVASDSAGGSSGSTTDDAGAAAKPVPTSGDTNGFKFAFTPTAVALDCNDDAAKMRASGAAQVTFGTSTMIAGYQQINGNDQDPIVARFDGDSKVFCEHTKKGGGVDARAYGVTWDGKDTLYAVFTVVGGGTAFDAAAKGGWVSSYGDGGASAKVMVAGQLDARTGVLGKSTFVPSKLVKNGQKKTNTLTPADAVHVLADGTLEIFGNAAYCTLNPDQSSMCKDGGQDYPKGFRARFSPDFTKMLCASATGVSNVTTPCP